MSACISRHGEYSSHVHEATGDHRFVCARCWVLDEDAILAALEVAESALSAALAAKEAAETENERLRETVDAAVSDADQAEADWTSAERERDQARARAERAEAERGALLAQVAAVEALLPNTDEQFPIFPFQIREALGVDLSDYILIPRAGLALATVVPSESQKPARVFHQATHGTGVCPRCGESVMRPGQWVTDDPARVNCSPSEPQETTQ